MKAAKKAFGASVAMTRPRETVRRGVSTRLPLAVTAMTRTFETVTGALSDRLALVANAWPRSREARRSVRWLSRWARVLLPGVLLLGIILAAGCGSGSGPAESQRVLHIWLDANQRELAFFGKAGSLIEAAHPGLRLRWKQVRLNDLKPVFLGHARQSREPDLVLLINDWVGELVRHGLLAEVPGSFPALLPPMLEAVTLEGRLYGVPWSFEALGGGR